VPGGIVDSLAGAFQIMLGRPEGLNRLDLSLRGFWQSFAAIILVLPFALVGLVSTRHMMGAAGDELRPLGSGDLAIETVAILLDWVAFPLVFAALARPLGLGARYVPFIVARNWASVVIAAMLAVLHGLHIAGLVPAQAAPFLMLAAALIALRFLYVVARTALAVSVAIALPLVILDLLITITISTLFDRFS
jgi:hypothetical protein